MALLQALLQKLLQLFSDCLSGALIGTSGTLPHVIRPDNLLANGIDKLDRCGLNSSDSSAIEKKAASDFSTSGFSFLKRNT
jgi:hypothetical protein